MADISETGAGFYVKSSSPSIIQVALDEVLTIHFYINQRLYLPLKAKVVRMQESEERILVGAEFLREESEGYQALLAFLQLMDTIPHSVNLQ